jgi:hypothetical protein
LHWLLLRFFKKHLFNEDGDGPMELLNGDKLVQVMDKFTTLCSPNARNLVAFFKHWLCIVGYIYSIFSFKAGSGYDYIQDSCFPRQ